MSAVGTRGRADVPSTSAGFASPPGQSSLKLIKAQQVYEMTGLGPTYVYKMMKAGQFPKSVPIGRQRVAWVEVEVNAWIAARIAARDRTDAKEAA